VLTGNQGSNNLGSSFRERGFQGVRSLPAAESPLPLLDTGQNQQMPGS